MKLAKAIKKAQRVYLCGNGGSAANAIHIANDLIAVGIKAQALTADIATLTAIANDFGYQQVFSRQLMVLGQPGDLLIALSGSGNSPNILNAVVTALDIGMEIVKIFGNELGENMQQAEETQIRLGHEAMLWIKTNP